MSGFGRSSRAFVAGPRYTGAFIAGVFDGFEADLPVSPGVSALPRSDGRHLLSAERLEQLSLIALREDAPQKFTTLCDWLPQDSGLGCNDLDCRLVPSGLNSGDPHRLIRRIAA